MLSGPEARLVHGLRRRKVRESQGLFLAEGSRVAEELLATPIVLRLALVSSSLGDTERGRGLRAALAARTPVREVSEAELGRLSATQTPQGAVVVAEIPRLDLPWPDARATALVLDAVQDPGNLGTLARIARAFGISWIAGLPGTVDAWNPKAVRASAGALFHVPVVYEPWVELRDRAQRSGFTVVGASAGGLPIARYRRPDRVALVLGNEGVGLRPEIRADLAATVAVPMRPGSESLNVATAAAVLAYALTLDDVMDASGAAPGGVD
ncbi:MAG: TrmH family RNA methyltransferase [Longimicrobiales bacterium]